MRGPDGFLQGYNAQAVATERQVIVAAEISTDSPDGRLLEPMAAAARKELVAAGVDDAPGALVADAGYWNEPQIEAVEAAGTEVLVATEGSKRREPQGESRKLRDKRLRGRYLQMDHALRSRAAATSIGAGQQMVEPVFAQTKVTRRADRFQRRGLSACRSEWRPIAATHNLLKL